MFFSGSYTHLPTSRSADGNEMHDIPFSLDTTVG
jgi:hypothetical protein